MVAWGQLDAAVEGLLAELSLSGPPIVALRWLDGLRDFELCVADGRGLRFEDCLQVGYHRPLGPAEPPTIGSWWTDEPSPVLLTLGPEVRLRYQHLVLELGEGLLRVACRSVVAIGLPATGCIEAGA
jgi:hypothetical protein